MLIFLKLFALFVNSKNDGLTHMSMILRTVVWIVPNTHMQCITSTFAGCGFSSASVNRVKWPVRFNYDVLDLPLRLQRDSQLEVYTQDQALVSYIHVKSDQDHTSSHDPCTGFEPPGSP